MEFLADFLGRAARELASSTIETLASLLEKGASNIQIERALSSPRAREFWALLRPLRESGETSGREIALGLRVALRAHDWHESHAPELVWTGPSGEEFAWRRTEQALLDVVTSAKETLWLITYALYPVPSLSHELEKATRRGVELRVVAESPETEKIRHSGLSYWHQFLPRQTQIYEWPLEKRERNDKGAYGTLHAKVALADRDLALISSANLTDCALNYNVETGVLLRGPQAAKLAAQFQMLVKEGIWRPEHDIG